MSWRYRPTMYRPPVRIIDFVYMRHISIIDQECQSACFSAPILVNCIFIQEYQFPCIEKILSVKRKCKISAYFLRNNNLNNTSRTKSFFTILICNYFIHTIFMSPLSTCTLDPITVVWVAVWLITHSAQFC